MGDSRRTAVTHEHSASRLLSLSAQRQPIDAADEPVDWLDFFPAENGGPPTKHDRGQGQRGQPANDDRGQAPNVAVSTFVLEPAPIATTEPSRRRRRSRGRLRNLARRITGVVLQPFRLALRACRWVASGTRRGVVAVAVAARSGVTRAGSLVLSGIQAFIRLATALVLLPWRLLTLVIAFIRTGLRAVQRLAHACQRLVVSLANAVKASVAAIAASAIAVATGCLRAIVTAVRALRRGVGAVGSALRATGALAIAAGRAAVALAGAIVARIRGAVALLGAAMHGCGRAVVVTLRAVVMLVRADIRAVRDRLRRTANRIGAACVAVARFGRLGVARLGTATIRAADLAFEPVRRAHSLLRAILFALRRAIHSIYFGLQRAAASVRNGVIAAGRGIRRVSVASVMACHAFAVYVWALPIRASRAAGRTVVGAANGCHSMATWLTARLADAIHTIGHAARIALVAAGDGIASCLAAAARVGEATVEATKEGAAHTYAAGIHIGHEAAVVSSRAERRLQQAATHTWQTASRETRHTLDMARTAELSIVGGAVRMYRATAIDMATPMVVIRIPTILAAVPHLGRGHLLASALATAVLLLISGLARVGEVAPRAAPTPIRAGFVTTVRTPATTWPLSATALTPLAPLSQVVHSQRPPASPTPSSPALVTIDRRAIQSVLNQYRDAMSTLDVTGLRTVWPTANADIVRASFASLVEQNVEFERCRISPAASGATAACAGVIESGFTAGQRRPRAARTRWEFRLEKTGRRWTITAVDTLPG